MTPGRDQFANICWIIEKAREFQKNICFIDYVKPLTVWITPNCGMKQCNEYLFQSYLSRHRLGVSVSLANNAQADKRRRAIKSSVFLLQGIELISLHPSLEYWAWPRKALNPGTREITATYATEWSLSGWVKWGFSQMPWMTSWWLMILPSCLVSGKAYLWELLITFLLTKSPAVILSSHNVGFLLDAIGYINISEPTPNVSLHTV